MEISGKIDNARISFSEAARWLIHLNAFYDSSGKASTRGMGMESPGAGWLGKLGLICAEGQSLFQTLLLNLVLLDHDGEISEEKENPVWEGPVRTEERVKIARPENLAELYTLQSRRLLLMREDDAVTGYKLLGGDFFEKENAFVEPMTLWRYDKKTEIFTPKRHNPARQIWRDFEALIASKDGAKLPGEDDDKKRIPGIVRWNERLVRERIIGNDAQLRFSTLGIQYDDKGSSVVDIFSDAVSFNARLLGDLGKPWRTRIVEILRITDKAAQRFGRFASDLALAEGASDEKNNVAKLRDAAREQAYEALDIPFRTWLAAIKGDESADERMIEWKRTVKRILRRLANEKLEAASNVAFSGRNSGRKTYLTAYEADLYFSADLNKILILSTPSTNRKEKR